jgi:hypothetical protein
MTKRKAARELRQLKRLVELSHWDDDRAEAWIAELDRIAEGLFSARREAVREARRSFTAAHA